MAGITHSFVSGIADGADTTLVRPIDWNATHTGLTIVRKTADEIVNNSTVLQNDDHLLFAVAANEVWEIRVAMIVASTAVADFKYAFTVPTGGAIYAPGGYTTDSDATIAVAVLYTANQTMSTTVAVNRRYIGGANAGNVQFQWAQNTAEVSNTKVLANSYIIAHKLA